MTYVANNFAFLSRYEEEAPENTPPARLFCEDMSVSSLKQT